jgi:hypothetical protein
MSTGDWSGMILNNYDSDRSSQVLEGQYGEYAYITSGTNSDTTNRPHLRLGYLA